ncbi:MAG: hypothetical protein QOC60_273 [Frankiaceae bacterium]|nr:hypothetical protein [Frankiaceae bacterium]
MARRFVRVTLREWDAEHYEWTAEALMSELATNAVIHARTDFLISLQLTADSLVLAVTDGSVLLPKRRRFETTATTGRGIRLVEDLATSWSAVVKGDTKVVSCVIVRSDSAGRRQTPSDNVIDIVALLDGFGADDEEGNMPDSRDIKGAA